MASVIRTAKVFRNGGSQAIRLPKDFHVTGDEVLLKQDFGMITILPKRPRKGSLLALLNAIGPVEARPARTTGMVRQARGSTSSSRAAVQIGAYGAVVPKMFDINAILTATMSLARGLRSRTTVASSRSARCEQADIRRLASNTRLLVQLLGS